MTTTDTSGHVNIDGQTILDGAPIEGEHLVSVNGVTLDRGDGKGVVIEMVASRPLNTGPNEWTRFAELTVWMGPAMVTITIHPSDTAVVDLADHDTAATLRSLDA